MEILIVGLSHKTAPLDVRETISFSEKNMEEGVRALVACPSVSEGLIVSTCNRVEVYSATSSVFWPISTMFPGRSLTHTYIP
jgi:glutamyl-tRNA reductase